jgi:hypothetical protein
VKSCGLPVATMARVLRIVSNEKYVTFRTANDNA